MNQHLSKFLKTGYLSLLVFCIYPFLVYTSKLFFYPYEWEPTDGDHLNFIIRLLDHKPIYIDMAQGWVLSIYNPLYHSLVAGLIHVFNITDTLQFARQTSIIFLLLTPIVLILHFILSKNNKIEYSLILGVLIFVPAINMFFFDLNNVSPNSFLLLGFTLSLIFAERFLENKKPSQITKILFFLLPMLTYLAKQQGLVVFFILIAWIVFSQFSKKLKLRLSFGLLSILISTFLCLDIYFDGLFLKSTFFDVNKIIHSQTKISTQRLRDFLLYNIVFISIVIIGIHNIYSKTTRSKKNVPLKNIKQKLEYRLNRVTNLLSQLSVWQMSFLVHLPFLFKILGNAGGGNNYFATFWVTVCVLVYQQLNKYEFETKYRHLNVLFVLMILNTLFALTFIRSDFKLIEAPNEQIRNIYAEHMSLIQELVKDYKNTDFVLANRNIGSLIQNNFDINIEGATTFNYLIARPDLYNANIILNNIRNKAYRYIFSGIQKYPADYEKLIQENYKISKTSNLNLYYNHLGEMKIYSPK